jgi:pimeloyl-ACP methyl ester carboxylesterase
MPTYKNRRAFLQSGAAASLAIAARSAGAQPTSVTARGGKTYVLVHGSWCGGWFFDPVADRLRAAGHRVFTPTQTGLGERKHLLSRDVTLDTFVDDLVNVLECEELRDVILVGHSSAGGPITGVADRMPDRIQRVVYLDAVAKASSARRLLKQPEKDTATALLDRLRQAKRGGVRAFQQVMPDVRQARHAAEMPAHQVVQRRSVDLTLAQAREFIAHAVERVVSRFVERHEQTVSRHHDGPSLSP